MPRHLEAADVAAANVADGQHADGADARDDLWIAIGNIHALGDLLQLAAETRANFMKGTLDAVACMLTREAAAARECLAAIEREP